MSAFRAIKMQHVPPLTVLFYVCGLYVKLIDPLVATLAEDFHNHALYADAVLLASHVPPLSCVGWKTVCHRCL